MSIGPLGPLSSIAATPLSQATVADVDRIKHDVANRTREAAGLTAAERAAGIAATEQEQAAEERDADGRRIWELAAETEDDAESAPTEPDRSRAKDPTGDRGTHVDLSG